MAKKEKVILAWGGGKESAVTIFELKSPEYKLKGLISVFSGPDQRLVGHGIRRELVLKQAESLELPLEELSSETTSLYPALERGVKGFDKKGLNGVSFGEVQSDVKHSQHEVAMAREKLNASFPLWKWQQKEVLRVFFSLGYKAVVTAVNPKVLPATFAGRPFDREFLSILPSSVDPCGEKGEFRTFVYDGPFFQRKIEIKPTVQFELDGLIFQDFQLAT